MSEQPREETLCERCRESLGMKWRGLPGHFCEDCLVWMIDDDIRDFR